MSEIEEPKNEQTEILTNEYAPKDSTVVVDEKDRTVVLTDDETIIIQKDPLIDIAPKNRPRKVYAGMWGLPEIVAVSLGVLALLAVFLFYMFVVTPAQRQLKAHQDERDQLERDLATAKLKYGNITTTEARVAELVTSVSDFESRYLPDIRSGQTALYQRLNNLIAGYGLINTTGPDYAPLEINERQNNQSEAERGRAKFQSLFPGVYVTMTVEGSYQNLRRFLRDLETSGQFVVISTVELQPADNEGSGDKIQTTATQTTTNAPVINNVKVSPSGKTSNLPANNQFPQPNMNYPNPVISQPQQFPAPQSQTATRKIVRGKTHGETVSLHLEMAAYFKRQPVVAVAPGNTDLKITIEK